MENDNEIWLRIVTVKIAAIIKGVSTTKELRKLLPVLFKRRNAIFLLLSKISIFFETLINLGLSQFSLKLKLGRVSVVLRGKQKNFTVLIFTLMKNKFKTVKLFLMMKSNCAMNAFLGNFGHLLNRYILKEKRDGYLLNIDPVKTNSWRACLVLYDL